MKRPPQAAPASLSPAPPQLRGCLLKPLRCSGTVASVRAALCSPLHPTQSESLVRSATLLQCSLAPQGRPHYAPWQPRTLGLLRPSGEPQRPCCPLHPLPTSPPDGMGEPVSGGACVRVCACACACAHVCVHVCACAWGWGESEEGGGPARDPSTAPPPELSVFARQWGSPLPSGDGAWHPGVTKAPGPARQEDAALCEQWQGRVLANTAGVPLSRVLVNLH